MSGTLKKTNAMRQLDTLGIQYDSVQHEIRDAFTSGSEMARMFGQDPEQVFKTLVTEDGKGGYYVCVIPVDEELDLKKAARQFGVKKLDMLPMKKLLPLTGYVHGGCSPVGMKKLFPTAVDETAQLFDRIYVSGGRVGLQLCLSPEDLNRVAEAFFGDLTV
ncbi:MAG: Cys-tRNA(Pro) deacylase [Firmicutes bacterium]|nr:Cys-tRNA(Pro) deacylase [Bacillota bacterium]